MGPKTSADADVSCKASSELRSDRIHLSHQTEGETQTEDCATSVCPSVIISRDNPLLPSRDPSCVSCLRQAGRRHRVSCCFLAKAAPASQSDSTTWAKQLVFSSSQQSSYIGIAIPLEYRNICEQNSHQKLMAR